MSARLPDEILEPNASPVPNRRPWLKDMAMAVPNLAKLLSRLARDPRVPARSKRFAGLMAAYLISPIDLIPDFIPLIGKTDDVVLAAFTINHLIQSAGYEVVREHWDGSDEVLGYLADAVDFIAGLVPRTVRLGLGRWLRG
ncbi:MAG TPA: DUF1232 domain-containing protein [Actinobacteria bacterium]|nr:DUF1232 domain-containing protein [Actinomycetota bacterium]